MYYVRPPVGLVQKLECSFGEEGEAYGVVRETVADSAVEEALG
jgi:hypothetical protein